MTERTPLQKCIDEKIKDYAIEYKYDGEAPDDHEKLTDEIITHVLADNALKEANR